jgi:hypothetical protein
MKPGWIRVMTYATIWAILGLGAAIAYLVGWFFDSLMAAYVILAIWAIAWFRPSWQMFAAVRAGLRQSTIATEKSYSVPDTDNARRIDGADSIAAEKLNSETWSEQLAGIVAEFGTDSPDIQICVYPQHTYDVKAKPLLTTRPGDFDSTVSRLRHEFGGGTFWVIVFARGKIRRRFALLVNE